MGSLYRLDHRTASDLDNCTMVMEENVLGFRKYVLKYLRRKGNHECNLFLKS